MIPCEHYSCGRCALAESIAKRELGVDLECKTTDENCKSCLSGGPVNPEKPHLMCLGTATRACPKDLMPLWSAYVSWVWMGKSRGLGDTVAKIAKKLGIKKSEGCGCAERQSLLNKVVPYSKGGGDDEPVRDR